MKNCWKLGGTLLVAALVVAGSARADETVERWPGAVCVPNHAQSAANIVYNSAGSIANISEEEPAWIVCPVRTPYQVTSSQTVVWNGNFHYSASSRRSQCSLRLVTTDGSLVASTTGSPTDVGDSSSSVLGLTLAIQIGDVGVRELEASVHCELAPSGANERSAGVIAAESHVLD